MGRVVRPALAVVLAAVGVLASTSWGHSYRVLEARVASSATSLWTQSYAVDERWVVKTAQGNTLIVVVTSACTTSLLVLPLFLAGAVALLLPRLSMRWTVAALGAGSAVLFGLGTVRLSLIGYAWYRWGVGAIWVAHDVLGTIISVISAATALGLMLLVISRKGRFAGRRFEAAEPGSPTS